MIQGEDLEIGQTAIVANTAHITVKTTRLDQSTFRTDYEHPDTGNRVLSLSTSKNTGVTSLDYIDPSFWTLRVDEEEKPITDLEEELENLNVSETQIEAEEREIILHTEEE